MTTSRSDLARVASFATSAKALDFPSAAATIAFALDTTAFVTHARNVRAARCFSSASTYQPRLVARCAANASRSRVAVADSSRERSIDVCAFSSVSSIASRTDVTTI
eukprot:31128-Pelagococcus_subviridis.AAC.2